MSSFKFPNSMEELVYWTNRSIGEKGKAACWVYKQDCPKCKKAKMGKPVEKGKVKTRAKEYVCPACNYTVEKTEYEETLEAQVEYTCPTCKAHGEAVVPFQRKMIEGVKTLRVKCHSCAGNIDITKKMKAPKKKGAAVVDDDDDD